MQGHWGCVRYIYIGSAADGVLGVLTILMSHREHTAGLMWLQSITTIECLHMPLYESVRDRN